MQIATMLATFVVGILLARGLGVQGYGQYGIAMAVITLAGVPSEFGLSRLVMRETAAASARKDWQTFFGVIIWAESTGWRTSGLVAVLIIAGLLLFGGGSTSTVGTAILWGVPIIPLFALAKIRAGALQGVQKTVLGQASTVLLRPVFLALLLLTVVFLGGRITPQNAMAFNTATAALAMLASYLLLKLYAPARRPTKLATDGRRWLASTIPLSLTDAIRNIQAQLTILLLGFLAAPAEVGLFRVAASTTTMLVAPILVVNIVAMPLVARLHAEGDKVRLQKLATHAAQAQFVGVLLLSLPLFVAGEPILGFLFGPEYESTAGLLRFLLAAQLVNSGLGLNAGLLNMTHHERRVTRAMAIALMLNILLVVALAPIFGMYGAAIGYVVSMTTWNLLTWWDARQLVGIDTSLISIGARR